jgi:hypothetical protein
MATLHNNRLPSRGAIGERMDKVYQKISEAVKKQEVIRNRCVAVDLKIQVLLEEVQRIKAEGKVG